jgi:excisionase family DNA binding protein
MNPTDPPAEADRPSCPLMALDAAEAAAYLGVTEQTIEQWVGQGRLLNVFPGSAGFRFRLADLEAFDAARQAARQVKTAATVQRGALLEPAHATPDRSPGGLRPRAKRGDPTRRSV